MLLRGNKILLIGVDDESQMSFPDDYWMIQDISGREWRKCDIMIARCDKADRFLSECLPEDREEADNYWGSGTKFHVYETRIPSGPWKYLAGVIRIGYRRGRKGMYLHPGPNENPLSTPVKLYESTGKVKGYRLRLPSDCIVDDRGFVYP